MQKIKTSKEYFKTAQTLYFVLLGLNSLALLMLSILTFQNESMDKDLFIIMSFLILAYLAIIYILFLQAKKGFKIALYFMAVISAALPLAAIAKGEAKPVLGLILIGFFTYNTHKGMEKRLEEQRSKEIQENSNN